jgi:hypothetical protein
MLPAPYPSYVDLLYPPPRKCKWAQLWCQCQSTKEDNYNEGGDISSPYAESGAILTRVKDLLSVGIVHVKAAIIGPSESMNEQRLIPLLPAKSAKNHEVDPIILDGSMQQHAGGPFLWMIKFSGTLLERKEELMIVNSNGDENRASMVKGGAFVWEEWELWKLSAYGKSNAQGSGPCCNLTVTGAKER